MKTLLPYLLLLASSFACSTPPKVAAEVAPADLEVRAFYAGEVRDRNQTWSILRRQTLSKGGDRFEVEQRFRGSASTAVSTTVWQRLPGSKTYALSGQNPHFQGYAQVSQDLSGNWTGWSAVVVGMDLRETRVIANVTPGKIVMTSVTKTYNGTEIENAQADLREIDAETYAKELAKP